MEEPERRYRRSEHAVFRKIHDEMLLVPIKDNAGDLGCSWSLNSTGTFIWQCLDGSKRLSKIIHLIGEEFKVGAKRAENDLCTFVSDLLEIGATQQL
jgi:hypothetical protein